MINRKYIFAYLLCTISFFSAAQQNFSTQWSSWYDPKETVTPYIYLGEDASGYFGLFKKTHATLGGLRMYGKPEPKQEIAFFKMDRNAQVVFTKEISLTFQSRYVEIVSHINVKDKYYLFGQCMASDKQSTTILIYTIDKRGTVVGSPIELLNLPVSKYGFFSFNIHQPKNADFFFISTTKDYGLSDENEFRIIQIDEQFKKVWAKDFTFPAIKGYNVEDLQIGKSKLYWKGYTSEKSENHSAGYYLSCYDLKTKEVKHVSIKVPEAVVHSCSINLDESENAIVSGFFLRASDKNYIGVDGFYLLRFDKSDDRETMRIQKDFPEEFLLENTSEKNVKLKRPVLPNLLVRQLITRDDNSMVIIGEQAEYFPSMKYGSIVTVSISNRGEVEWFKTIRNIQGSVVPDNLKFYSYILGISDGDLYFIYNENNDNENRPDPLKYAALNDCHDANTTLSIITRAGKLSRQTIYKEDNLKHETCVEPINTLPISKNTFILYRTSHKQSQAKIGILKFGNSK